MARDRTRQGIKMSAACRRYVPVRNATIVPRLARQCGPISDGIRKLPRQRGTVASREIHRLQRSTVLLIPTAPFQMVVQDIARDNRAGLHLQAKALQCLQEATEAYLVAILRNTNLCASHAKRSTITVKDMQLALNLRDEL